MLVIIGILLAIAVPSYLGFKDRANKTAAQANVRSAIPAAETFYADNNTYAGISLAELALIDAGVKVDYARLERPRATRSAPSPVTTRRPLQAPAARSPSSGSPATCP